MNEAVNPSNIVIWGGFVLAFVFGALANKSNFCTMGAISDVVNMENWGRVRMWLLAIAVAMLGANLLHIAGLVDLSKSVYQRPSLPWLSMMVGGVLFGVGMTMLHQQEPDPRRRRQPSLGGGVGVPGPVGVHDPQRAVWAMARQLSRPRHD